MKELIFNFHGIGAPPAETDPAELPYWLEEASFVAALDAIEQLQERLDVPVALTFDDGNRSDVQVALPILVKRGLGAAFFVCTGRLDHPDYLDQTAINDLLQAGMKVGSHGVRHMNWRDADEAELEAEIVGSKHHLEDICGRAVTQAGIPFGSYDRRVLRKAKKAGYQTVFSSDRGYATQGRWLKPRLTLDRFWQEKDMIAAGAIVPDRMARLKRHLITCYKRLR